MELVCMYLGNSESKMEEGTQNESRMLACDFHLPEQNEVIKIYVTEKYHIETFKTMLSIQPYTVVKITGSIAGAKNTQKPIFKMRKIEVAKK